MHIFIDVQHKFFSKCKKVNYSLTQKVAETVALEQRLTTAECQNRAVSNKLYRHNELTKASKVVRNKLRKNRLSRIIHFFLFTPHITLIFNTVDMQILGI